MSGPLPVYIGYDLREHAAYMVCASTVEIAFNDRINPQRAGMPIPINTRKLRRDGLFTRTWRVDAKGRYWDDDDGKSFSTEFSHSRFLTPYLAAQGKPAGERGWALFCDCDFMFRHRVSDLLKAADPAKAVMVVKHAWSEPGRGIKMDGQIQAPYRRKLWSSLILWNLDHPANAPLIENHYVANTQPGSWLHGFDWLDDDLIGELSPAWNYIPGHTELGDLAPSAIHWSFGGPWMPGYYEKPFANEWRHRYAEIIDQIDTSQPVGNFADIFPLL